MVKLLVLLMLSIFSWAEVDEAMIDEEIAAAEAEASEAEVVQKAVDKTKTPEVPAAEPSEMELEIAKLRQEVAEYQRQKKLADEKIKDNKRKPASVKSK